MSIGPGLFERLSVDAPDVAAIVGAGDAANVYPRIAPDDTYPHVIYELDNAQNEKTYDGNTGEVSVRARVSCVAKTGDVADDLAEAVKARLDDADGVWAGKVVQGCFLEDDGETIFVGEAGADDAAHERTLEFLIWYETGA